jgi:hypothetical protein
MAHRISKKAAKKLEAQAKLKAEQERTARRLALLNTPFLVLGGPVRIVCSNTLAF